MSDADSECLGAATGCLCCGLSLQKPSLSIGIDLCTKASGQRPAPQHSPPASVTLGRVVSVLFAPCNPARLVCLVAQVCPCFLSDNFSPVTSFFLCLPRSSQVYPPWGHLPYHLRLPGLVPQPPLALLPLWVVATMSAGGSDQGPLVLASGLAPGRLAGGVNGLTR